MSLSIQSYLWCLIFLILSFGGILDAQGQSSPKRTLILISLDGFRHDYLDSFSTPNLDLMAERGTRASSLIPVFPTKTFPNHYSIVTGLYPSHHGILSNRMYDPDLDAWFRIGAGSISTKQERWFGGEPIWITAEKQQITTATCFWPGADAIFQGIKPTHHLTYNPRMTYDQRIAQVLEWLQLVERPGLITLYFESPDREGHRHGPRAPQVAKAVNELDTKLGKLLQSVRDQGLAHAINWLIVSDHGMTGLSPDRLIFLDDYLRLQDVTIIEKSPKADLIPAEGKEEAIFTQLHGAHPNLQVYRKGETPLHWKFTDHARIAPIMAVADEGWTITTRTAHKLHPSKYKGGTHGYDPNYASMHGIFIACGPDIKRGLTIPAFENIHIYPLMCNLLKIRAASNDGHQDVARQVLN